jgi:transcriptional regulator with XRE-family HTH domain
MNSEIIKFIRKCNGLTQREFAKVVNCSCSLVALVELGERRVTKSLERKILAAFDLEEDVVR